MAASSTKAWMFFAQRPQQPASFKPNLALIWQGITIPSRPASRTSESVIPLHKHRYMSASLAKNDYEKHSQYVMTHRFCQQAWVPFTRVPFDCRRFIPKLAIYKVDSS